MGRGRSAAEGRIVSQHVDTERNISLAALHVFRSAVEQFARGQWLTWDRIYAGVAAGSSEVIALPAAAGWSFVLRVDGAMIALGAASRAQIGAALDEHVFGLDRGRADAGSHVL
jgi:hypothetical protein